MITQQPNYQLKCAIHPNQLALFIQVNDLDKDKNIFYCQGCVIKDPSFISSNYIQIDQIKESNDNCIVDNWPIFENNQLKEISEKILNSERKTIGLNIQINQFYDQLQSEIQQKIEISKKKMMNILQVINQQESQTINNLKEVVKVDNFRNILLNDNLNIKDKENNCRQFINCLHQEKSQYTQKLQQIIEQYYQIQQSVNFDLPNQIKNSISILLEQICFFNIDFKFDEQDCMNYQNKQSNDEIIENIHFKIKHTKEFKQISSILNNKSNFLKEDFQDQFEKYIILMYPFLKKINFDNIFKENQQLQTFINIDEKYLQDVSQLISIKQQFDINNNYNHSFSFKVNENASALLQYNKQDLNILLQQYPIYDLLKQTNKSRDILSNLQLIISQYEENSNNFKVEKLENNTIQIISPCENNIGTFYSNFILESDEKYVFRFQFKRNKKEGESLMIGLIRDQVKDNYHSYHEYLSCDFYYTDKYNGHCAWYGIDEKVRGDLSDTKNLDYFELRVSINDEILEVLDYPNYNHKIALSDKYKSNLKSFSNLKLAIYLQHSIEFKILSASTCEQFQY